MRLKMSLGVGFVRICICCDGGCCDRYYTDSNSDLEQLKPFTIHIA